MDEKNLPTEENSLRFTDIDANLRIFRSGALEFLRRQSAGVDISKIQTTDSELFYRMKQLEIAEQRIESGISLRLKIILDAKFEKDYPATNRQVVSLMLTARMQSLGDTNSPIELKKAIKSDLMSLGFSGFRLYEDYEKGDVPAKNQIFSMYQDAYILKEADLGNLEKNDLLITKFVDSSKPKAI